MSFDQQLQHQAHRSPANNQQQPASTSSSKDSYYNPVSHQQDTQSLYRAPSFQGRSGFNVGVGGSADSSTANPALLSMLSGYSNNTASTKRPASSPAEAATRNKKSKKVSNNGGADDMQIDVDPDALDDDESETPDPPSASGGAPSKVKATRGSRACTVCRRLKMKCVGAEQGPPCKRCITGKHECVFEESNRGKRTSKKHEVLTKSIKKMEQQLETVMRSLKNPTLASLVAANAGITYPIPGSSVDDGEDELAGGVGMSPGNSPRDHQQQQQQQQHQNFGNDYGNSYNGNMNGGTATTQQLTKHTENLTSHSPVPISPTSPRLTNNMNAQIPRLNGNSHNQHRIQQGLTPQQITLNGLSVAGTLLPGSHPSTLHSGSRPSLMNGHSASSIHVVPPASDTSSSGVTRSTMPPPSPTLNTLPDNSLNPLGLLAEASLANRRADQRRAARSPAGRSASSGRPPLSAREIEEQLVEQAVTGTLNEDGEPVSAVSEQPPATGSLVGGGAGGHGVHWGDGGDDDGEEMSRKGSSGKGGDRKVGVANETYFRPGPINILPLRRLFIERQVQPEMLSFVSTEEVIDLFRIYFTHMNMHCSLLGQDFHTPSLVCSRSPFLLTVICAIASKFYTTRPDLHPRLNRIVKKLSFNVPERGFKSLEIVQAYLLLALYGCGPVERYEQDKTWLMLGLAIRMGTDLNLHRRGAGIEGGANAPDGRLRAEWRARERELRNRERTWILCYILDRSLSAQMGKPHSIIEDYIIRNTSSWFRLPETVSSDAGLAGYAEMQRILSRSLDFLYSNTSSASGLHTDTDYLLVIKTIESQLYGWQETWEVSNLLRTGAVDLSRYRQQDVVYVSLMTRFYFHYAMLVVNSFGLQNALERSRLDIGHFFGRCYSSAMACALVVRDELGPQGFLRYSPDSHFVLSSYAVLTLLKLIRPEFQAFMESEQRTLALVTDVADTLESVAINPSHTPALYSTFLRAVITARTAGPSAPPSPRNPSDQVNLAPPNVNGNPRGTGLDSTLAGTNPNSPADLAGLASNPAAGVFGDEQQFGDGALGLKMFPAHHHHANQQGDEGIMTWQSTAGTGGSGGDLDLQAAMSSFQLPNQPGADDLASMSMDNILSGGFWDNVLIPGYSSGGLEGLSGGFVYGTGGSGFITPRRSSPEPDASNNAMQAIAAGPSGSNNANLTANVSS